MPETIKIRKTITTISLTLIVAAFVPYLLFFIIFGLKVPLKIFERYPFLRTACLIYCPIFIFAFSLLLIIVGNKSQQFFGGGAILALAVCFISYLVMVAQNI